MIRAMGGAGPVFASSNNGGGNMQKIFQGAAWLLAGPSLSCRSAYSKVRTPRLPEIKGGFSVRTVSIVCGRDRGSKTPAGAGSTPDRDRCGGRC